MTLKNGKETEKQQEKKLKNLLPEDKKEELEEILRYGEKIKSEGEKKKKAFWSKSDILTCQYDFYKLLDYKRKHQKEIEKDYKYLDKMEGIGRKKYVEEYLCDEILYNNYNEKLIEIEKNGGIVEKNRYSIEDRKEGKIELKEGDMLNFIHSRIGDDLAEAISKMGLKEGVYLDFSDNKIGDAGAVAISKMELKEGVTLKLMNNEIGDKGAEGISKMKLKEGVTLDLRRNRITDDGAKEIVKMRLKDGVCLNLIGNPIGEETKEYLKEWEQSYRDKGINCEVSVE